MLSKLEATDIKQRREDLNEKLNRLADAYSDVEVQFYRTGGSASQRLSHAINQVIVGSPAPEIAAADIDGKPFRLSKFRGKIVVLVFTQSTSDDYGKMDAPMRQLVAKYRQSPVRVVGIMSNFDRANLRAASQRGDLPWTVIPQPVNGPLCISADQRWFRRISIVDVLSISPVKISHPQNLWVKNTDMERF